ncbi:MAG: hypothetical protein J6Q26_03670, partial [Bacteroidales bacterium]|nr:hypothetical protein [Bacteroidales bacterium]
MKFSIETFRLRDSTSEARAKRSESDVVSNKEEKAEYVQARLKTDSALNFLSKPLGFGTRR